MLVFAVASLLAFLGASSRAQPATSGTSAPDGFTTEMVASSTPATTGTSTPTQIAASDTTPANLAQPVASGTTPDQTASSGTTPAKSAGMTTSDTMSSDPAQTMSGGTTPVQLMQPMSGVITPIQPMQAMSSGITPVLLTQPMTGDTAPAPFVGSTSSNWDSFTGAWQAFDQKNTSTGGNVNSQIGWQCANNKYTAPDYYGGEWIMINLGSVKTLTNYNLRSRGYSPVTGDYNQFPRDFTLSVSTDGVNFTDVDTHTDVPQPTAWYQCYSFTLNTPVSARFVKITVTRARAASVCIGEIELYGADGTTAPPPPPPPPAGGWEMIHIGDGEGINDIYIPASELPYGAISANQTAIQTGQSVTFTVIGYDPNGSRLNGVNLDIYQGGFFGMNKPSHTYDGVTTPNDGMLMFAATSSYQASHTLTFAKAGVYHFQGAVSNTLVGFYHPRYSEPITITVTDPPPPVNNAGLEWWGQHAQGSFGFDQRISGGGGNKVFVAGNAIILHGFTNDSGATRNAGWMRIQVIDQYNQTIADWQRNALDDLTGTPDGWNSMDRSFIFPTGAQGQTDYIVRVSTQISGVGTSTDYVFSLAPAATPPPANPPFTITGLTIDSASYYNPMVIRWDAPPGNATAAGYKIYVDGQLRGAAVATSYTINDLSIASSPPYLVQVFAVDAAGSMISKSALVKVFKNSVGGTAWIIAPPNIDAGQGYTVDCGDGYYDEVELYKNGQFAGYAKGAFASWDGHQGPAGYWWDDDGNYSTEGSRLRMDFNDGTPGYYVYDAILYGVESVKGQGDTCSALVIVGNPTEIPPAPSVSVEGHPSDGETILLIYDTSTTFTVHYKATAQNDDLSGIRPQIQRPNMAYSDNEWGDFEPVSNGSSAEIVRTYTITEDGDYYFRADAQTHVQRYYEEHTSSQVFHLVVQHLPNSPPTATLSANYTAIQEGDSVTFTVAGNDSDGNLIALYLNLDIGMNFNLANPSYIYNGVDAPDGSAGNLSFPQTSSKTVTQTITFTKGGKYTFLATARDIRNDHGCSVPVTITVNYNDASFDPPQNVPDFMIAGSQATVSVTAHNNGSTTWSNANAYNLGSQNPQDNGNWGLGRVSVGGTPVPPGNSKIFTFTIIAPTQSGNYDFQWRMVQDGREWFGAFTPNKTIKVINLKDLDPETGVSIGLEDTNGNGIPDWIEAMFGTNSENINNKIPANIRRQYHYDANDQLTGDASGRGFTIDPEGNIQGQ